MSLAGIFQEVIKDIGVFAPTIASAIGGPPGLVINFIVPLLAKAFNADVHNISDIIKNIQTDNNSQQKFKDLENTYGCFLKEILSQVNNLQNVEFNVKLQWKN